MTRVLLLQGANMEWLGRRQPELYGTVPATELDAAMQEHARERGVDLKIVYTNHEGEAISRLYEAVREGVDGLLMNPAGFVYSGTALRDCLLGIGGDLPYVEVHITNLERRGTVSAVAPAADGYVAGFGLMSYIVGFDGLLRLIERRREDSGGPA